MVKKTAKQTPRKPAKDPCEKLLRLLSDYVDGSARPALCRDLEKHLAGCKTCRVVVDNVRQTITLYRKDQPCELPVGVRHRLHSALKACWKSEKTTSL